MGFSRGLRTPIHIAFRTRSQRAVPPRMVPTTCRKSRASAERMNSTRALSSPSSANQS